MRQTAILIVVLILALAVGVGVRFTRRPGVFRREVAAVKPGEMVAVETYVHHKMYFFGYEMPYRSVEIKEIVGVTLHDYESGKLIGRFHDAGAKLCPHCNGVGEVKEESR